MSNNDEQATKLLVIGFLEDLITRIKSDTVLVSNFSHQREVARTYHDSGLDNLYPTGKNDISIRLEDKKLVREHSIRGGTIVVPCREAATAPVNQVVKYDQ